MKTTSRPLARAVVALGVILLGAVAATRLPLHHLPSDSFPELRVELSLAGTGTDVAEVEQRWLLPLETAIRSTGAGSVAGEVGPDGATLRVRLAPSADPRRKAARLESELAGLRRRLAEEDAGRLSVSPVASGGERSLVIWLGSDDAEAVRSPAVEAAVVEAIRDLRGVRSVDVAGEAVRAVRWTVRDGDLGPDLESVATALFDADPRPVGSVRRDGRRLPVLLGSLQEWAGERPVALRSLAEPALGEREPFFRARVDGRAGVVLTVSRLDGVSPLELESQVLAAAREHGEARILSSEAEPIRRLLRGLARGAATALLLGALAAFLLLGTETAPWKATFWQAAAVPLAAAAAVLALWLLGLSLDLATAVGLVVGVGGGLLTRAVLPRGALRATGVAATALVAAWLLVLAVRVLGHDLGALLSAPVRAFAAAASASVLALLLLPPPPRPGPRDRRGPGRVARFVLRRPWAVVLAAGVFAFGAFGLFGHRLVPRSGELRPAAADLVFHLDFARGATLGEATSRVAAAEAHLLDHEAVEGLWSYFTDSRALLSVTLDEEGEADAGRLARLWQGELAGLGGSVRAEAAGGMDASSRPLRFDPSLALRAEADLASYRFLLRSTDASRLLTAHRRIRDHFAAMQWTVGEEQVQTRWTPPAPRLELRPRPEAARAEVDAAVHLVASRIAPTRTRSVVVPGSPGRPVVVEVAREGTPDDASEPPQLADVLTPGPTPTATVVPSQVLTLREAVGSPTLRREDGRFVLPVTVSFTGFARGEIPEVRSSIHRILSTLPLPGVDVEKPDLYAGFWTEERLRLLAIALVLPLLFLALAAVRLDSLPLALAAGVPGLLALAAAAYLLALLGPAAGGRGLDELGLLALAATLAASLPVVLETAASRARSTLSGSGASDRPGPLAGAAGYRWLVRRLPHLGVGAVAWTALLLGVAWDGLGSPLAPSAAWAPPLAVAAGAGLAVVAGACLVLPGLLRAADALRFHDRGEAERRARPPAWRDGTAPPLLEVHRLVKIYPGAGGEALRALDRVSFRLEPGIVGLLGPNGAGKTTLLRHLCGLLRASRGQVLFRGVPLRPENLPEYRRRVGFLPQEFDAYEGFTAESFLDFWALERGIRDRRERRREVERLISLVGLEDAAGRRVRDFSGGMRRRIGIARSLLGSPPILIVDEPTTGLDVESRNRLRESLLAAAGERIILFSTHIASDVAATASRILLLHRGRLLFDGKAGELIDQAEGRVFETILEDHQLRDFSGRYRVTTRVRTLDGIRVRAVAARDQEPAGEIVRPNLEEAYLARLGETAQRRPSGVGSLLDLGL